MRDSGLDRLPYDLWHVIFQLVCTDGGRAGCVLAQTSRSFRALSAPSRFHSLALSSLAQVKNLLICLERIRRFDRSPSTARADPTAHTPPIVLQCRHLLLSFLPGTCDAPQRTFRKWTDYAHTDRSLLSQLAHDHRTWTSAKTAWNRAFVLHVSRLLQLAAPALRALAVLQCPEVRLPLVQYRLPALRELTLLGDDRMFLRVDGPGALVPGQNDPSDFDFYSVSAPTSTGTDAEPPLPALARLHVVCAGPKLHPWEKTLPQWAAIAPALTHLRISQGDARVPPVLAQMLGVVPPAATPTDEVQLDTADSEGGVHTRQLVPQTEQEQEPEPEPEPEPETLYASLRVVIVQMSGARKRNAAQDPDRRELERIRDECASFEFDDAPPPQVTILRSRAYMPGYWESRLPWEWRERMLGGGGCWTADEADEDVWKVFPVDRQPGAGKKRKSKGKSEVAVNVRELPGVGGSDGRDIEDLGSGKKWWKALANGIPRVRKRSSVV